MSFSPGDKVLVDGNIVATIHTYNEDANVLVYETKQGGGTNLTYGHITSARLELLEPAGQDQLPLPDTAESALVSDEPLPVVKDAGK